MSEVKHTPTPWVAVGDCIETVDDTLNDGFYIATVYGSDYADNAAHIVKCVNMHDELVEVLQWISDNSMCEGAVFASREALKKAGALCMSETKFTQGQWSYGGSVEQVWGGVIESCGYHVASAHGKNDDECKANAHLIAAAPDLYEALDGLVTWMWSEHGMTDRVNDAVKALVKARGES